MSSGRGSRHAKLGEKRDDRLAADRSEPRDKLQVAIGECRELADHNDSLPLQRAHHPPRQGVGGEVSKRARSKAAIEVRRRTVIGPSEQPVTKPLRSYSCPISFHLLDVVEHAHREARGDVVGIGIVVRLGIEAGDLDLDEGSRSIPRPASAISCTRSDSRSLVANAVRSLPSPGRANPGSGCRAAAPRDEEENAQWLARRIAYPAAELGPLGIVRVLLHQCSDQAQESLMLGTARVIREEVGNLDMGWPATRRFVRLVLDERARNSAPVRETIDPRWARCGTTLADDMTR